MHAKVSPETHNNRYHFGHPATDRRVIFIWVIDELVLR
jgi:hypothetical protein